MLDTSLLISVPKLLTPDSEPLTEDEAKILGANSVTLPASQQMKLPPEGSSAAAREHEDQEPSKTTRSGRQSAPVSRSTSSKPSGQVSLSVIRVWFNPSSHMKRMAGCSRSRRTFGRLDLRSACAAEHDEGKGLSRNLSQVWRMCPFYQAARQDRIRAL